MWRLLLWLQWPSLESVVADALFALMRFEKSAVCIREADVWFIQGCRRWVAASPVQGDVGLEGTVVAFASGGAR